MFITGCETLKPIYDHMPLTYKSPLLDLHTKPIGLFSISISNQYKKEYQPEVRSVEILSETPEGETQKHIFHVNKSSTNKKQGFYEYLISFKMKPGTYKIGHISGYAFTNLYVGSFKFPINATVEVKQDSIVYLGNIEMINRKARNDETRSGSGIPIFPQAASGFGDGTFDITISDKSYKDIEEFKKTYPVLVTYPTLKKNLITTQLMTIVNEPSSK